MISNDLCIGPLVFVAVGGPGSKVNALAGIGESVDSRSRDQEASIRSRETVRERVGKADRFVDVRSVGRESVEGVVEHGRLAELRLQNLRRTEDVHPASAPVARLNDVVLRNGWQPVRSRHRFVDPAVAKPRGVLLPKGLIATNIKFILVLYQGRGIDGVKWIDALGAGRTEEGSGLREYKLRVRHHARVDQI